MIWFDEAPSLSLLWEGLLLNTALAETLSVVLLLVVLAQKLLPPALDWDVASHVTANVRDKTVDVALIYSVKAPK